MAKSPSILDESLNRAAASVANLVLQQAISKLSGSMSIGELVDDMSSTGYNGPFRSMTLNAFVSLRNGENGSRKSAEVDSAFNTRTQTGREEMDAAVIACLESQGTVGTEQIRQAIGGGSAAQIRESIARLTDQGSVTRSGAKRGTKYSWKGKSAKKAR